MKAMLLLLCAFSLLFAMELDVQEKEFGNIEYTVRELGSSNSTLHVALIKGQSQYYFESVDGFNGVYKGSIPLLPPGTYTLNVADLNTGDSAEKTFSVLPSSAEGVQKNLGEMKSEVVEESTNLHMEESFPLLPWVIVGLFVVIMVILIFANPLKKKKK